MKVSLYFTETITLDRCSVDIEGGPPGEISRVLRALAMLFDRRETEFLPEIPWAGENGENDDR